MTNYFGDAWSLKDTSLSVAPITQIRWDFLYTGTFAADRTAAKGDTINPAYFPCDSAGRKGAARKESEKDLEGIRIVKQPFEGRIE